MVINDAHRIKTSDCNSLDYLMRLEKDDENIIFLFNQRPNSIKLN